MPTNPAQTPPSPYGRMRTAADLGALCRAERKRRGLTLAELYDATALSPRFLSEFERGKEHASIGRALRALNSLGLDVIVVPRGQAKMLLRQVHQAEPAA